MKYAPRKVYIKKDGDYVELSYQDFCRRRQADRSYMDKLFIPVQGCLLEVVREQYTDFYRDNVRYIAVNDGVDTLNKSAMDITPFHNILNEMYSADVSVKIKSAYRARFQQGKFMGTYAPYDYIKDPADHNHLLIDEIVIDTLKKLNALSEETCAELTATTKRRKLTECDHSIMARLARAKEQAKQPTVAEGG